MKMLLTFNDQVRKKERKILLCLTLLKITKASWWELKKFGWLFDDCRIVPNEWKIKKISLEAISNTKIFKIKILFNDFSNDQDFTKLSGGLDNIEYSNPFW